MLEKTFTPAAIEAKWYAHWEQKGLFRPSRPDAEPFTIVLPPPNVTGTLHIGHALDQTLQDILIRWQRLKGKDARWVVGTDHAGIATQMVVERTIASQGLTRQGLGRQAFLNHVWEWKEQSGGAITRQMRRLGASADWSNERFTMDEGFNKAVIEVFVRLHEAGLIYRDKRLVNWDPKFQTAISDLEVETRETQGHFWHLRYPLADGSGHLVVATTRPETMLGDTAVAVNPSDGRHAHLIGQKIAHPLTGRLIPIVGDEWADPELGSGCVKITPAHDFNDWQVYERHKEIGWINILDSQANILADESIPQAYRGLDRFEARKAIVADLDALGLLERVEDKVIQTPYGDRSGVVIEPWLTDQWYIDTSKLAVEAREAVTDGRTSFVPKAWEKTYFNWMDNIQPWCISRQLWWGHRIPAWFTPDGAVIVARSEAEAQAKAGAGVPLRQDEDVLDTWFSSGLWPFVTLGWPEQSADLARGYPGSVLVTGFDIIFFWVARMMMFGLKIMEKVPFETVYIHGLVRDAKGQKMSKSKGNTVDPLELIDRYGADALRFTMAASETQGRDVKFDEKRVEGYRNFATKLWNAVRFAQAQGISAPTEPLEWEGISKNSPAVSFAVNRWIISETVKAANEADIALSAYRFDQYAQILYHFVWSRFCDRYLELIKPILAQPGGAADEVRQVAGWVIDQILILLHPVMPFITEELWHSQGNRGRELIVSDWPELPTKHELVPEIEWVNNLISEIRSIKSAFGIDQKSELVLYSPTASEEIRDWFNANKESITRESGATYLYIGDLPENNSFAEFLVGQDSFAFLIGDLVDVANLRARLQRHEIQVEKERASLDRRLSNPAYIERAEAEEVEKTRENYAARTAEAERLRAALARLG